MERVLQPELLDTLSPTDPEALHNRRDLRLTNAIMRNHAWLRAALRATVRPDERVLELGAGDGGLARGLHQVGIPVDGLDFWPPPMGWSCDHAWHCADLRQFSRWQEYQVVCGNLIFHQFSDADLRAIGEKLQGARAILACEPTRRRRSQWLYAMIAPLLGANRVTLHDAHVSIAAGFRAGELPRLLGLAPERWLVRQETTALGAYRMIAVRR